MQSSRDVDVSVDSGAAGIRRAPFAILRFDSRGAAMVAASASELLRFALLTTDEAEVVMERARYCLAAALLLSACCAHKPKLPPPGGTPPGTTGQGIIWLNHHDLVVADWERITLSTNGTAVFVDLKTGVSTPFPEQDLIPIFVPTLPPGEKITGMRVCYAIVGNHPDTKVHRLRLAQFDNAQALGGTTWPAYVIKMEDLGAGNSAPTPPAGGFAFNDRNGFVCVDSTQPVCLDPGNGTISADTGVQLGDQDDRIVFMAIGLHYDSTCTPN